MKTIKTNTVVERFECDVCHKEYAYADDAKCCEKRHRMQICKHKHLSFNYEEGVWTAKGTKWSGDMIEVTCNDCDAYFGRKNLMRKQTKEIQEFFKKLYFDSPEKLETPDDWLDVPKPKCLT